MSVLNELRTYGWEPISAADYADCFERYGGSLICHPEVLEFIHQHVDCQPAYWGRSNGTGQLLGALCAWGEYLAGDPLAIRAMGVDRQFDFGTPELILPWAPGLRTVLGFRGKFISARHQKQILNLSLRLNSRRCLCLAKSGKDFSPKTHRKRRNELRHFIDQGGEVQQVSALSASDFSEIYCELHASRWNRVIPAGERQHILQLIRGLQRFLFGHVLLFKGRPCATDLILSSSAGSVFSLENINGGIDTSLRHLSPGSLLNWLNICSADRQAQRMQQEMRFSFGRNSSPYKQLWCHDHAVGRVMTF